MSDTIPWAVVPGGRGGKKKCSFVLVFNFSMTPTPTGLPNYNMQCDHAPITSLPIIMDIIPSTVSRNKSSILKLPGILCQQRGKEPVQATLVPNKTNVTP